MALHFFEFLELFMIDALSIKSVQFQQKRIIRDFFLAGNLIIKIQLLKKSRSRCSYFLHCCWSIVKFAFLSTQEMK